MACWQMRTAPAAFLRLLFTQTDPSRPPGLGWGEGRAPSPTQALALSRVQRVGINDCPQTTTSCTRRGQPGLSWGGGGSGGGG